MTAKVSSGSSSSHPEDGAADLANSNEGQGVRCEVGGEDGGGRDKGRLEEAAEGNVDTDKCSRESTKASKSATNSATAEATASDEAIASSNVTACKKDVRELTRHDSNISNDVFYNEDDIRGK